MLADVRTSTSRPGKLILRSRRTTYDLPQRIFKFIRNSPIFDTLRRENHCHPKELWQENPLTLELEVLPNLPKRLTYVHSELFHLECELQISISLELSPDPTRKNVYPNLHMHAVQATDWSIPI